MQVEINLHKNQMQVGNEMKEVPAADPRRKPHTPLKNGDKLILEGYRRGYPTISLNNAI